MVEGLIYAELLVGRNAPHGVVRPDPIGQSNLGRVGGCRPPNPTVAVALYAEPFVKSVSAGFCSRD